MRHFPRDEDGHPIPPSWRGELLVRFKVDAFGGEGLENRTDELFDALRAVDGVDYVEWNSETEEVVE